MKNRSIHFLISILILSLIPVTGSGQLSTKEVDRLVEDAMEKFDVAGVAVGIVKDGEVFLAKGYGVRSVEGKEKVDENTSFAIASNSKAFTSAALALLVEEGKLSWNDRVVKHIPEFKMYNEYVTQNFIILDLLTHRSGLGLGAGDLQFWPHGSDFSMADLLTNFQYFEPVSPFRTKYDYDNILYIVAGEVIKRVSGQSWESFVQERILDQIGMDNSSTMPPSMSGLENMATPHMVMDGKLETIAWHEHDPVRMNGAMGAVLSNADDLSQWLLLHLNEGKYGESLERQLFTKATQREMWKIHTSKNLMPSIRYNPHFSGYGLGWNLTDMNGRLTVYHTGDISGMLSKTIMIPELELGVLVLTNSYYGGAGLFQAVTQTILDGYLGLEPYDWTGYYLERHLQSTGSASEAVAQVWETVKTGDHHMVNIENYIGVYEDKWFGKVEIYLQDGKSWFRSQRSPQLTGPMYHYKANAFAIKWENREMDGDAFAIFSLDEEGVAQQITMKGVSPDLDFSFDFQDLLFERTGE
ncbi:MAG: serine hydrolase [Bacteroidetes bacterium]|nr:serine hydrolase [Bacteroidota bacterium]